MEEFLNREDVLELIIYYGGGAWIAIAIFMAYFKTKKEFGSLKILKFFGFIFDYTIGFALVIIEMFTGNKSGGSGSNSSSERTITKVKPIGGGTAFEVYFKYSDGRENSFSRGGNELVNWNAQSFTTKTFHSGGKCQVNTYDATGHQTDTYWEQ